ncbi:alpha/beta hydrolase-fold protein [Gemmatimonadota bacterium]
MKRISLFTLLIMITMLASGGSYLSPEIHSQPAQGAEGTEFAISFSRSAHSEPITGRVYVMLSAFDQREPRFQVSTGGVPFYGIDVVQMAPGEQAVIDDGIFGYPVENLRDIPPGEYFVQAFVNIYTEFKRSDGHTLWMHNDQWEGQHWNRSPGNLYSDVMKVRIDPARDETIELVCDNVIPPVTIPEDTGWVKRIRFQSSILTEFWGEPMYLGATILLPRGYEQETDRQYPVNYIQGHFSLRAPNGFREGGGNEFSDFWMSDECPRMLAVTFQHPCPQYDDSYVVNSPNVGPYGDAIMQELIPWLEEHFRIIREPYARVLSGGSTGGWISLAMQIFYPDFFGGVFSLCPDPVDFHYFQCVDIYEDDNAYYKERGWLKIPTASDRRTDGIVTLTYQQRNHFELTLGTKGRSGDQVDIFEAAYGPIGEDGYVKPLFDKMTGEIDREVAEYWREHFDLNHILQRDWAELGPKLKGKIHIYTGDMDTHYLNNAVVLMEEFLESTENPYYDGVVEYGDGQPHCWGPRGVDLLMLMAGHIEEAGGG